MLRRSYVVAAMALLLTPAFSLAQFKQGDWELTLAGTGLTPGRVDAFSFGASIPSPAVAINEQVQVAFLKFPVAFISRIIPAWA